MCHHRTGEVGLPLEVRGTALRSVLIACDALYGDGASRRVLDALDPAIRDALSGAVLGASWYPVRYQAALQDAVRTVLGAGSLDANKRVGRQAALDDFRGVYRIFLPLLTWDLLWASLSRAWLRYNSCGDVIVEDRQARSAICKVRGVDGYTEPMWSAIAGRLQGIIELAGGRDVRVRITGFSSTSAQVVLTWNR